MRKKRELVIVGNGMATCRLLDNLIALRAAERFEITVIGDEPHGAYNRIQLGKVLAGGSADDVLTKPLSWYETHGVAFKPGRLVERLDTSKRSVVLDRDESLHYDVAVLATGSKPVLPALEGMTTNSGQLREGIFGYRTLDDCLVMRAQARPGDSAVVLGGGLLGLEAGKALSDLGLHVTIVHLAHGLMNTQLDFIGGEMLKKQIERTGMFVRTGRTIERVVGDERLEGVMLDDGELLNADMLVVACGVRPRVEVAQRSKIPVNRGIQVNDAMATEVPGVYAIGECTEHVGVTYGLVAPAWEQADVLAEVLTGTRPLARYHGTKTYARLKVAGIEVASLGVLEPVLDSDRVVQVIEERELSYRKLIVRGRQLIGAMLVGNAASASALIQAFDREDPLPEDPLEALCSFSAGGSASSSGARTVCNCHRVSEAGIAEAVRAGACSVELVGGVTKAGTGCGSCKSEIEQLVQRHTPSLARSA
jgi:nitrite reductase (NADH) large subunit